MELIRMTKEDYVKQGMSLTDAEKMERYLRDEMNRDNCFYRHEKPGLDKMMLTADDIMLPETLWAESIEDERIYRAVMSLSRRNRKMLFLRVIKGLKMSEVAYEMSVSKQSASNTMRKILKHMRETYAGSSYGGEY